LVYATEYYIIEAYDSSKSILFCFNKFISLFFPFSGANVEGTEGAIILANLASYSSEKELVSIS